jgi:hypothetical protein
VRFLTGLFLFLYMGQQQSRLAGASIPGHTPGARILRYVKRGLLGVVFLLACTGKLASQTLGRIWPSTAVPSTIDAGPDSAVELGVRFSSA